MALKGSKTEKNILTAFSGESQARNRYTYFASQAKKEGFEQISAIFTETAEQEKEHAKRFFKFLEGGMVEITATFPAGVIGNTAQNLEAAAAGEHEEWTELYPEAARVAQEEGFAEVAAARFPINAGLVSSTVAPGSGSPLSSVIVPVIFPSRMDWAWTLVTPTKAMRMARSQLINRNRFVLSMLYSS